MKKVSPSAGGVAERVGQINSYIVHQKKGVRYKVKVKLPNHFRSIEKIVELLIHPRWGAVKDINEIMAVGHRVVHGGEEFKSSVIINKHILNRIKCYGKLSPLHNVAAYNGIKAAKKIFPNVKQVAVFDTSFHQTMPPEAFMYGLPFNLYKKYRIRAYGFHGTSHRYVAYQAARILKRPLSKLKLISCHLGNGCSIAAIKYGRSVDTSMGFTPLEGLIMGTRCGDIDPALVGYIMKKEKLTVEKMDELMNRKSGLLGLSGISSDMRDLLLFAKRGNKRAKLAINIFIYRVKKYIGAYIAAMNGTDVVVLTGGIGENVLMIKHRLKKELSNVLGRAKMLIVPTDEERLIAVDTYRLVMGKT